MSVVSDVCFQVEVSATGRSLVQGSPTDCGASCVLSRNLVNEEALTYGGLLRQKLKKKKEFAICPSPHLYTRVNKNPSA